MFWMTSKKMDAFEDNILEAVNNKIRSHERTNHDNNELRLKQAESRIGSLQHQLKTTKKADSIIGKPFCMPTWAMNKIEEGVARRGEHDKTRLAIAEDKKKKKIAKKLKKWQKKFPVGEKVTVLGHVHIVTEVFLNDGETRAMVFHIDDEGLFRYKSLPVECIEEMP